MTKAAIGKRIAIISIAVSASLSIAKIVIGIMAGSTSVVADGAESAGDVVASAIVLFGFVIADRPADANHPYGHGRYETLTGLMVGIILFLGGIGICYRSLQGVGEAHAAPALYGFWPLLVSMASKAVLAATKFKYGRRIGSSALVGDAWNDTVDIISAATAMVALGLTLWQPARFLAADHYGGFAVGLIVIFTGLRVGKDTSDRLTDAMPEPDLLLAIRRVALTVPGSRSVEKLFARNAGLQHYVDLHLEVDPEMTVRESHDVATAVRFAIREQIDSIADVLVHVEPWKGDPPPCRESRKQ